MEACQTVKEEMSGEEIPLLKQKETPTLQFQPLQFENISKEETVN